MRKGRLFKVLLVLLAIAGAAWFVLSKWLPKYQAKQRYKKGTATTADFELLGPAYWAECLLSSLEVHWGCDNRKQDGPTAPQAMADKQALPAAVKATGGAYNNTIDGCAAKLQYLRSLLAKTGRPKVWGIVAA